jgi:hypothetical protein
MANPLIHPSSKSLARRKRYGWNDGTYRAEATRDGMWSYVNRSTTKFELDVDILLELHVFVHILGAFYEPLSFDFLPP